LVMLVTLLLMSIIMLGELEGEGPFHCHWEVLIFSRRLIHELCQRYLQYQFVLFCSGCFPESGLNWNIASAYAMVPMLSYTKWLSHLGILASVLWR
jgi:hypothetical protein